VVLDLLAPVVDTASAQAQLSFQLAITFSTCFRQGDCFSLKFFVVILSYFFSRFPPDLVYSILFMSTIPGELQSLNESEAIIGQLTMTHSPEGLLNLEKTRRYLGVERAECLVGLETAHNLLIDFLWARQYPQIYVIPPSVINSCRGRYGSSRARDDWRDGRLIADVLRTDRGRLYPWRPNSLLTGQLGAKVSLINHLTASIVARSNRLRAVLLRYYPATLSVFSSLTTQIALHFLQQYPTPQTAPALSWLEFEAFALAQGYPQPKKLPECYARLQQVQLEPTSDTVLVYQAKTVLLAQTLLNLVQAKNECLQHLTRLFKQHPDYAIFHSLPGAGDFLAPALLSKFGDDRQRFPTPAAVQALAGTCPVTDSSGKRRRVKFRTGCDHDFRQIAQQWARHSLNRSVWANA
jgi:transposase